MCLGKKQRFTPTIFHMELNSNLLTDFWHYKCMLVEQTSRGFTIMKSLIMPPYNANSFSNLTTIV